MKQRIVAPILALFLLIQLGFSSYAAGIQVTVNDTAVQFDQEPIIENDRVLVPVRKIFEALGATVSWTERTQTVTANKNTTVIILQIGKYTMLQNGKIITLDVAPKIVGDRTLVPIRAVSESFGAQVEWLEESRSVQIHTTPISPSPSPSPSPSLPPSESNDFEKRVFELVNEERQKQGLSPLSWSDSLAAVARAHSKDMNDRAFMAHENPDRLSPFDRMKNYGIRYSRAAENIAAGQTSPEAVMKGWMNSSGHRANILNPNLTTLGVGFYKGDGPYRYYWTQCFITP
jgi:uncharacterized YkwD family protein